MKRIIIKPIDLEEVDQDRIIEFLDSHKKTQVVSRKAALSRKNVVHAVKETERAYREERAISHVPKIGLLLHLVGNRQIQKAIEKAKVRDEEAVFICFNSNPESTWEDFQNEFKLEETEFEDASDEEIMDKMERTATFWLE